MNAATILEDTVDGDRCLRLTNERMAISINVDHGAHLFELIDRRSGIDLLYTDPAGSRHYDVGGWYELFPNAGVACDVDGRSISAHGDVQHAQWTGGTSAVPGSGVAVTLSSESVDLPFSIVKTISLSGESARLRIEETITNRSARRLSYLWGQHITFGEAFLQGSVVELPPGPLHGAAALGERGDRFERSAFGALTSFPTSDGRALDLSRFRSDPFHAMLFSEILTEPGYRITNDRLGIEAQVSWDRHAWPYLWFWAQRDARAGGVVACAVEPQACDVPVLSDAIASGRCPTLGAGQCRSAWVEFKLG